MKQEKIPFFSAVLMAINIIVGAGIYAGPQIMAGRAGTFSFLGWGLSALVLFPLIWNVALAARMFPGEGGFFNYCKSGINERVGFIATWSYFLGFLAVAATQSMFLTELLYREFGWSLISNYPILYNALFIGAIALLNLVSITIISRIQSLATILKLSPMLLVIVMIPFYWNSSITYSWTDFSNLGYTIPMAIFGYWGFESCCNISHMIEGGSTKAFNVILTAFTATALLYMLFHIGILHIMGAPALVAEGVAAFPNYMGISSQAVLQGLKILFLVALVVNYANAIYGVMLTNITSLADVAQRRFVFLSSFISKTNSSFRPVGSVILVSVAVFLYMSFIPDKEILLAVANIGIITVNLLALVAVFNTHLKRQAPFWQKLLSILGFIGCLGLYYFSWTSIPGDLMIRILYISPFAVGLVFGLWMYKQNTPGRVKS